MLILVLGKGKTGSLVAEVARERGHGVRALDIDENAHASALTAPNLASVDVVAPAGVARPLRLTFREAVVPRFDQVSDSD